MKNLHNCLTIKSLETVLMLAGNARDQGLDFMAAIDEQTSHIK